MSRPILKSFALLLTLLGAAASGQLTTLPNARLAILPATSHLAVAADPTLLSSLVTPFLDDVPPLQPSW